MEHRKAVCTVIAKNYIAHARTMVRGFHRYHPRYACYVLIVDEFEGYVTPAEEDFEIISLDQIELPNQRSMCFKYNVTELCTATKPFFLDHLLRDARVEQLLYIDPDILITNSLDELYRLLDHFDIVLTPHAECDYPDDGRLPDDTSMMQTGLFNLGFLGLRASSNTRTFLEWWKKKVYRKCLVQFELGLFVDQKFMDLALLWFDGIHVERGSGYNVAYWNLHSRDVRFQDGIWTCNGGPLYFFHFSGYRPDNPTRLTTHVREELCRYRLDEEPEVRAIFREYAHELRESNYFETQGWPYTFASFVNGKKIPDAYRRLYRESLEEMEPYGDPFSSEALERRLRWRHRLSGRQGVVLWLASRAYRHIPGLKPVLRRMMGAPAS